MNAKTSSHSMRFQLAITAEQFLAFYQGTITDVVVHTTDNRSLKFPASAIRHFLTRDGIYGIFEIYFDGNNKLIKVEKLSA